MFCSVIKVNSIYLDNQMFCSVIEVKKYVLLPWVGCRCEVVGVRLWKGLWRLDGVCMWGWVLQVEYNKGEQIFFMKCQISAVINKIV